MKPVIVIKAGTAAITKKDGTVDQKIIGEIARQLSEMSKRYSLVLVSSGAVGAGKSYIKNYEGELIQRKIAAAIGNPILINTYSKAFAPYKITVAQSLCERGHFANRQQFLNLRSTFEGLWENNAIPIVNENDVVSNHELKFSDNDELATLIAAGFGAKKLLFATSVKGVLNKGKLVKTIEKFDDKTLSFATGEKSDFGLGGMVSKLNYAKLAVNLGIETVIFGLKEKDSILKAERGETGTVCIPKSCSLSAHERWLASGSLLNGKVIVDDGAITALNKRKSLLAVGIKKIMGEFSSDSVFEIANENIKTIAIARAKISSKELAKKLKQKGVIAARADDIVLL